MALGATMRSCAWSVEFATIHGMKAFTSRMCSKLSWKSQKETRCGKSEGLSANKKRQEEGIPKE